MAYISPGNLVKMQIEISSVGTRSWVTLVSWFIGHTSKTKLGDYVIPQNVLFISGMDYSFFTPLMSGLAMYVAVIMKWAKVLCVFS